MSVKFNLIAAACENMGIGKNNDLPWKLRNEMKYFTQMTSKTSDPKKQNVIIMGRKTWDSVPAKFKPFTNRINFVLSHSKLDVSQYDNVHSFTSLEEAVALLQSDTFRGKYEKVWVIGGSQIYKKTMDSEHFYRLYLTEIKRAFDCDTFFPPLGGNLKEVMDPQVPAGVQQEGDIQYVFKVYENNNFSE